MPAPLDAVRLGRQDWSPALDLLLEAFVDDPGWQHVVGRRDHRVKALRTIFLIALRTAGENAWAVRSNRSIVGVATWPAPGTYPLTPIEILRATPAMLRLTTHIRTDIRRLARFGSAVDEAFPDFPVRYLQMIGVGPDFQGQGVGRALMNHGLTRADQSDEQVYLETSAEGNIAYYESFGFEVMEGSPSPIHKQGPVMWRMLRPANV